MKTYLYRNHRIVPKRDHGSNPPKRPGWIVCDEAGICNVAPGATWFHSLRSARHAIDVLIAVGGERNSQLFWEVIQPNKWKVGNREIGYTKDMNGSMAHGRYSAVIENGVITSVNVRPLVVRASIIRALKNSIGVTLPNVTPCAG